MSWIEDATEVLAEGTTPEGKRMQIVAELVEHSDDLMPDGDCYVPTMYVTYSNGRFSLGPALNGNYFPLGLDDAMNGVLEACWDRFDNWEEMAERWLRIMGAKGARVREVQLDQSSWGVMVSAYGQKWQDMTGVDDDYTITDSEEFENWLKGEVSWISARVADHDCNCEYCEVEWAEMDDVIGMSVYASPWGIQQGINGKYAYVLADMIAQSEMIQREVAA